MKVLLTGGTGFLGGHLLPLLNQEHDVVALCRRPVELDVPVVRGDLLDPESLVTALEGCDAVIHAGGHVSHAPESAGEMHEIHVVGTQNLLAAAIAAGVKRFVYLSSSGTVAVSTDPDRVATERDPTPMDIIQGWPYYRAKAFAEQHVLAAKGIDVVVLNPSILLGPGDTRGGSTRPIRYFLEDKLPGIPPGGLSFVDVRDAAEAAVTALTRGRPGDRYLLGAANMSFAAFYQRLARISGKPEPRARLPRFTRKVLEALPGLGKEGGLGFGAAKVSRHDVVMSCHTWYLDATRARVELGWTPRDPGDTLRDTIADLVHGGRVPA